LAGWDDLDAYELSIFRPIPLENREWWKDRILPIFVLF
jgi:hypothetical protein